jgi:hypothetical protein
MNISNKIVQFPCNAIEINNKMFNLIQINSQENMLLKSFEKFYESLEGTLDFLSIIKSKSKISIRLIDHFVTKYSKKNKILYKLNDDSMFNVFQSYKQQLKIYQKKNFDPFARGIRIPYFIGDRWIITTIGQLNFFKWFISKKVLDYVNKNILNIELDMNFNKKNKNKNETRIKKPLKIYKKNDNKQLLMNNTISNTIKNKNFIRVTF